MTSGEWDPDDVLVVLGHRFGDVEEPLAEWMVRGPGPRSGVRPSAARSRSTGETLALTVIPLAYRNDRESRALIAAGRIDSPWPDREGRLPAFDGQVADPERVDDLIVRVLSEAPPGPAEAIRDEAPLMLRRLAGEAQWEKFEAVVTLAGALGLVEVGPVLCEVLESDAEVPDREHIVDVLGQLKFDAGAHALEHQFTHFVYVDNNLTSARQCLRALGAIGGDGSRLVLMRIAWSDWPDPFRQWAEEELEIVGT